MSNQEILEKTIQKAIDNGFDNSKYDPLEVSLIVELKGHGWERNGVLMDIAMAKALWGDNPYVAYQYHKTLISGLNVTRDSDDLIEQGAYLNWRYHLQQMVIAPDPIKYLGEHLND